jgi:hypothetical protein
MKQLVNKAPLGDQAAVWHLMAMAIAWDGNPEPDSPTKQLPDDKAMYPSQKIPI